MKKSAFSKTLIMAGSLFSAIFTLSACGDDTTAPTPLQGKQNPSISLLLNGKESSTWTLTKGALQQVDSAGIDTLSQGIDKTTIQDGWLDGDTLKLAFNKDSTAVLTLKGPSGQCQIQYVYSIKNNKLSFTNSIPLSESISGTSQVCTNENDKLIDASLFIGTKNTFMLVKNSPFPARTGKADLFILEK